MLFVRFCFIAIVLLFTSANSFTYADLSSYEKLLSSKISSIVLDQEQKSLEGIDLKQYGITYLQRVDEKKREDMITYIEQKIENGREKKSEKVVQVSKEEKETHVAKVANVEKEEQKMEHKNVPTRAKAATIEATGKTLDYTKIQQAWMEWLNALRVKRGLDPVVYDIRLEYSAQQWNQVMISRDQRSHQRDIGDSFYNYKKIEQRFKNLGLEFVNIKRTTFVENVGVRRGWKCKAEECSDEVITELRGIFDYYLAEEGTKHDAHFRSMINPYFKVGGLAFDISSSNKLYFTVHYGTEIKTQ